MESEKRTTAGVGWRVTTPVFPGEDAMSAFYADAHAIIEENFRRVRGEKAAGMLIADYTVTDDGDALKVTLRMRMRMCGKVEWEKTVVHRWKDGEIAPRRHGRKK